MTRHVTPLVAVTLLAVACLPSAHGQKIRAAKAPRPTTGPPHIVCQTVEVEDGKLQTTLMVPTKKQVEQTYTVQVPVQKNGVVELITQERTRMVSTTALVPKKVVATDLFIFTTLNNKTLETDELIKRFGDKKGTVVLAREKMPAVWLDVLKADTVLMRRKSE